MKPISIPDRWDDATGIPGYMGELVGTNLRPNWRNNYRWDTENFTDGNANGLHDPGETYTDGNGNGVFDSELYDPSLTGYRAATDLGLELVLGPDNDLLTAQGQSYSIALPPLNRGTPIVNDGGIYRDNWMTCNVTLVGTGDVCVLQPGNYVGYTNQAMRDLMAQDPDAYWDPVTGSVQGSQFPQSPRVLFVPVHDPRIPITSGNHTIHITKVVAFFMEQMEGNAVVRARFLRTMGTGEACPGAGAGFVVECPTPARSTSWGQVKGLYR